MESDQERLTRAIVSRSMRDHVSLARSDWPSSSADHRTPRHPALATKLDRRGTAGDTLAAAGESLPASPVLTTKIDHIRESSPVVSVHALGGPPARFASSATSQDGSMHT